MSKSYHNTIGLFEAAGAIKKIVMGIVTDSKTMEEPKEPEGNSIYELYKLFASSEEVETMASNFRAGNYGYGHAKKELLAAYHLLKSGPGNRGRSACGPTHVARLEFPRETGLILRCAGKAGNPFQTTQGNRLSCRDQEGRGGSEEAVPGPSVFPSGEPGVSGVRVCIRVCIFRR